MILVLLSPGLVRAEDDSLKIALDKTLPGKFEPLTCEPFGLALYRNLVRAGGEAHYIVYNWKSMNEGWLCHAIVVFRDSKGQYLGMDQHRNMPLLLPGRKPEEWIAWFNGPGQVELVSSMTDDRYTGEYADLSRKPVKRPGKSAKLAKSAVATGKKMEAKLAPKSSNRTKGS